MLLAAVMTFSLSGCDKEEENNIGVKGNPESNTTDVAVTGKVSEVGAMYAKLGGVVNLDIISVSYTNVEVGIEVSTNEDFSSSRKFRSESVVGRSFSAKAAVLQPDTKHYYRTYVSVSTLSFDYLGETGTFTTASARRDLAVTGEVDSIGAFHAWISGSANLEDVREAGGLATVGVEWSPNADMSDSYTTNFGSSLNSLGNFSLKISSLTPQTNYYYRTKVSLSILEEPIVGSTKVVRTAEIDWTSSLCHTWTIKSWRITEIINSKKIGTAWFYATDGTGHLQKIIDYVNMNHNAGLNADLGERTIVDSLTFTADGTFLIYYKDTDLRDIGTWEWGEQGANSRSRQLSYTWHEEGMGNDLLGGVATVSFFEDRTRLDLQSKGNITTELELQTSN